MLDDALRELHDAVETLNNPTSLQILNIDERALNLPETTRAYTERYLAWTQLLHISKSIPDLLNQSDSPPLVGFLGHFSSGKSSLINAILDTPGYKRDVGQHPTDTSITLIAHQDHAHLVKKSAYTAIDAIDVEHGPASEFLEHATLVDTPGLGNDAEEYEAVTRFLHLCHVLVLTIDGRCPFADKDKDFALLNTAFNKLEGVPKLLVVTCADQFLPSRLASFETDWQSERADAFWDETIRRLTGDPQFQDHAHKLASSQPFFVDSIDGFRVEQVREALLPVVRDDAQRRRTQRAQGRYVLATAHEALRVLLRYISERSDNLDRLHKGAQARAQGTETAVAELLQALESSFGTVRERLRTARQTIPSNNFAIETTVTAQAIAQHHQEGLASLQHEAREALKQRLHVIRKPTHQRLRRLFRKRTRAWFLTQPHSELPTPSALRTELNCEVQGLATVVDDCARTTLGLLNQALGSAIATSVQHLQDRSEAREIGIATSDIRASLERFENKHDDSIRAFHAYIAAPSSSDLLLEHGFVLFDESGAQAVTPEPIKALDSSSFHAIRDASETSKDGLRELSYERVHATAASSDELGLWLTLDDLGGDYSDDIQHHINSVCRHTLDELASGSLRRLADLGTQNDAEIERVAELRRRVWTARGTLARRAAWIGIAGTAGLAVLFASDYADRFASLIDDHDLLPEVVKAVGSAGILAALGYVIRGEKNETIGAALSFILPERWRFYRKWRRLNKALSADFEESYDHMLEGVGETPFTAGEALATMIVQRLKSHAAGAYGEANQVLIEVHDTIKGRGRLFDQFSNVVDQRLNEIPVTLRDRANSIKSDTVEKHLSRIRDAAKCVHAVEADVQRIVNIASLHSKIEL